MFARVLTIAFVLGVGAAGSGCEKPSHENIDKWVTTKKGPDKLKEALRSDGIDADLSAHAAAAMIKKRPPMDADVRSALEKMPEGRRAQVLVKLVPRLWDIARVEDEMLLPNPAQVIAKDMLVLVRKWADATQKQQIDAYLTDWYGVRSYVGRAKAGSTFGPVVAHFVGAPLGNKLIGVANSVVAAPGQGSGAGQSMNVIADDLLLGIAAAGTPETVKYILDLSRLDRGDLTLTRRAVSALYRAYVRNENEFDLSSGSSLVPHVDALVAIAKDEGQQGDTIDDSLALIRAAGQPACKAPLLQLVATPHQRSRFKYVAASAALACGGVTSIGEVVRALPDGAYEQRALEGGIAIEISKLTPKPQVIAAMRELLAGPSTLGKWIAIETLAILKSTDDVAALTALGSSKQPLPGYWGDNPDNKPAPTLGQRATELATSLK